jgi:hypothetical protein
MLSEDMARNPMAVVQAQARPSVAGVVHPTVDGMTPDDPGFRKKIPPPDPMSPVELAAIEEEKRRRETAAGGAQSTVAAGVTTPGVASPSTYRLLVTCSRVEGALVVGLECAPDWDVAETWTMTQESARCVARVVRALGVKIKDMSGGELGVPDARLPVDQGQSIPDSNFHGPRDQSGHVPDVRGSGPDHACQPVGRPDPNGESGIRALDPGSTTEFLEEARRAYEAELALKASEAPSSGDPTAGEASDDRENTLRRRLGLSPSTPVSGGVWEGPGNPNELPAGPDHLAPTEAPAQPE